MAITQWKCDTQVHFWSNFKSQDLFQEQQCQLEAANGILDSVLHQNLDIMLIGQVIYTVMLIGQFKILQSQTAGMV